MAIQIEVAEEGDCFASKSPQNPSGVPQNQNQNQNQNNEISNLQTNSSDSLKNINNDENNGSKKDFFTVYQRGIGKVNIICNTHEIEEKEIACRCLYQYCKDVPYLLWEYSILIIQSFESVVISQIHKSDDLFIIIGATIVLSIKMYLKYSIQDSMIDISNNNNDNNNNNNNNKL